MAQYIRNLRMRRRANKTVALSRSRAGTFFIFLFLLVLGAFIVLPIVYTVLQSIKPIEEYFIFPPRFWVQNPTTMNYRAIADLTSNLWVPFTRYLFNSLSVAIVGTLVWVVVCGMAAYPLAKAKIPGMGLLSGIFVWALLFKSDTMSSVQYMVVSKLGLIDTYWIMLLAGMGTTMGVFLLQQFITATVHDSTLEAARIDGASEFRILFSIVFPMVRAGWLTVAVTTFTGYWSNAPAGFVYSENLKSLSAVLGSIEAGGISRMGTSSAVLIIMMIPSTLVFIFTQRSIMKTMAHSGLK